MQNKSLTLTALLSLLEKLSDKVLTLDPGTRSALNKLAGNTLAVIVQDSSISFYVKFSHNRIELLDYFEGNATTTLTGSTHALITQLFTSNKNLYNSGVTIAGSTALLAELHELSHNIDIDWEEAISQYLGVLPAHGMAETLRSAYRWKQARKASVTRLLGEYLTEELGAVVGRREQQSFFSEVDNLRLSLDRFEARLNRYQASNNNRNEM